MKICKHNFCFACTQLCRKPVPPAQFHFFLRESHKKSLYYLVVKSCLCKHCKHFSWGSDSGLDSGQRKSCNSQSLWQFSWTDKLKSCKWYFTSQAESSVDFKTSSSQNSVPLFSCCQCSVVKNEESSNFLVTDFLHQSRRETFMVHHRSSIKEKYFCSWQSFWGKGGK